MALGIFEWVERGLRSSTSPDTTPHEVDRSKIDPKIAPKLERFERERGRMKAVDENSWNRPPLVDYPYDYEAGGIDADEAARYRKDYGNINEVPISPKTAIQTDTIDQWGLRHGTGTRTTPGYSEAMPRPQKPEVGVATHNYLEQGQQQAGKTPGSYLRFDPDRTSLSAEPIIDGPIGLSYGPTRQIWLEQKYPEESLTHELMHQDYEELMDDPEARRIVWKMHREFIEPMGRAGPFDINEAIVRARMQRHFGDRVENEGHHPQSKKAAEFNRDPRWQAYMNQLDRKSHALAAGRAVKKQGGNAPTGDVVAFQEGGSVRRPQDFGHDWYPGIEEDYPEHEPDDQLKHQVDRGERRMKSERFTHGMAFDMGPKGTPGRAEEQSRRSGQSADEQWHERGDADRAKRKLEEFHRNYKPKFQQGGRVQKFQNGGTPLRLPSDHPWLNNPAYRIFNGVIVGKVARIANGNDPNRNLQPLAQQYLDDDMEYARRNPGYNPMITPGMIESAERDDGRMQELDKVRKDMGEGDSMVEVPINRRGGPVRPPVGRKGQQALRAAKLRSSPPSRSF